MDCLKSFLGEGSTIAREHPIVTLAVVGLSLKIVVDFIIRKRSGKRLPPGPRSLPVLGNVLDFPTGLESPHWAKHHAKYGEFVASL